MGSNSSLEGVRAPPHGPLGVGRNEIHKYVYVLRIESEDCSVQFVDFQGKVVLHSGNR